MIPSVARYFVYPLHERLLRRPTFRLLKELEESQWWSREELEALQRRRLGELLRLARDHAPWHARRIVEADLDLDDPAGPDLADYRRLPPMTRADARDHGEEMVIRDVPGGAHPSATGGSSGEPLRFRFSRRRQASDAAGRMRARRWWGVEIGDREVFLWGAPAELAAADRVKRLRDRLVNHLVLDAFEMSPERMDGYLDTLQRARPRCLYGYASSVALLAAHARARGRPPHLPDLRVVCTTGEPLFPHQRTIISEVFGAPVANEFGSRDVGLTAHEAPEGRMLLLSESILLEVLDAEGGPVPPGELGEAVLTGLRSDAQPFLRYRTGDLVRVSDERDPGGRSLHVLSEVSGRMTDFLVRPDGAIVHALAAIYVLREAPGVAEFKVVQHEPNEVEALVVPESGFTDEVAARIEAGLRARLTGAVRVRVTRVDSIPHGISGKHRHVESRVPLPAELRVAP